MDSVTLANWQPTVQYKPAETMNTENPTFFLLLFLLFMVVRNNQFCSIGYIIYGVSCSGGQVICSAPSPAILDPHPAMRDQRGR